MLDKGFLVHYSYTLFLDSFLHEVTWNIVLVIEDIRLIDQETIFTFHIWSFLYKTTFKVIRYISTIKYFIADRTYLSKSDISLQVSKTWK